LIDQLKPIGLFDRHVGRLGASENPHNHSRALAVTSRETAPRIPRARRPPPFPAIGKSPVAAARYPLHNDCVIASARKREEGRCQKNHRCGPSSFRRVDRGCDLLGPLDAKNRKLDAARARRVLQGLKMIGRVFLESAIAAMRRALGTASIKIRVSNSVERFRPTSQKESRKQPERWTRIKDILADPKITPSRTSRTLWGLYNAIVYDEDFRQARETEDSRLERVWFGDGHDLKVKALNAARSFLSAAACHLGLVDPRRHRPVDAFSKGRDFGAWLGLVPKQISTGDRTILGSISKRGNRYLRALFVPEEDLGIPGFLKREQQPTADRACSVSCTARRLNWPGPVSYRAFFIQDAHLSILRRAASLLRAFSLRVY
jgi:Transposase IS116/IS110/IS902 family